MPISFDLGLGVNKPRILAEEGGGGSGSSNGDTGEVEIAGTDGRYRIRVYGDEGILLLEGLDGQFFLSFDGDSGALPITGTDGTAISGQEGDTGVLALAGTDGRYRIRPYGDVGALSLIGTDGSVQVSYSGDTGTLARNGTDGTSIIGGFGDAGSLTLVATDGTWEDDYIMIYDPVTVTVNASATTSSAFSIPGKIAWIEVPTTTNARTVTLQVTYDGGTNWISSGVTWTTSTSANTVVNSETLAKVAGATGPTLNNFRLSYDSSLTGNTSHTVRSRT